MGDFRGWDLYGSLFMQYILRAGAMDKSNSTVDLEFTAYPQPPCTPVLDSMHIEFVPCD